MKILVATDKPFAAVAVNGIKDVALTFRSLFICLLNTFI